MDFELPVILLKGLILLPHQEVRLELNNSLSSKIIDISIARYDSKVLVVCPVNEMEESPEVSDLPKVGVIGKIKTKIELPNGNLRVVIAGIERVKINKYYNYQGELDILSSNVIKIELPKFNEINKTAKLKKLVEITTKYINNSPNISNAIISNIKETSDIEKLTDMISAFIPLPLDKKLIYMGELNPLKRAEKLIEDLNIELEVIALDKKIELNLRKNLESSQKEFVLKEKIKEIKRELGEDNIKEKEVSIYKEKLNSLNLASQSENKLAEEIRRYELSSSLNPENSNIKNYLDIVLNLPWNEITKDETNLKTIRVSLDKNHYGLDKVKERIVEYIAMKKRNAKINSPIICLVGPSGVGKTTLAISIAKALKKEFYKISVGGLNDSNELIGHRRTYLGANPGKIMQGIKKCGVKNPLILIDEVDKMVKDFKGDPASTLLDILDVNQNKMFIDNFIEEPFDLSQVLFILTANYEYNIPYELRDRLEIINLSSYTEFEKLNIAKNYLIPNIFIDYVVSKNSIKISDKVILNIINNYTKEAGVRELDRELNALIRKVLMHEHLPISIKENDLVKYLDNPKYTNEINKSKNYGVVNALACTDFGGVVMPIECCTYSGKQRVIYTGNLGKIMSESTDVAISYIRTNAQYFKIKPDMIKDKTVHLHALTGSVPKDGPSAGITITTALLSLALKKKIPSNISMTGEISLNGDVYKIGGVKEKVTAAYNNKINKIYLSVDNENDIKDIQKEILDKIEFKFVKNYKEIFDDLFLK